MKKFVTLLLILCMVGGITIAQEGFSTGADANRTNLIDNSLFVGPSASYEMSVSTFDIFGELGLPFGLNEYGSLWISLDLNIKSSYNLGISPTGSMAVWMENWAYVPFGDSKTFPFYVPADKFAWGYPDNLEMFMGAGLNYAHNVGFGDIYGALVMPFVLLGNDNNDPLDFAMLNLTLGMGTTIGLGGGLTLFNYINKYSNENRSYFFNDVDVFVSYTTGPLSAKVTVNIPIENEIKDHGINIIPEAQYNLDSNITVFGAVPIQGVGSDYDPTVSFKVGGKIGF